MGTNFEEVHLPKLKEFKKLQIVYLFNTPVKKPDQVSKPKEGELFIDYGGYNLPKIATDSIVY